MDLKTYAVHRKLVFDDKLLDYAAKERDIPYAIVADSFKDYLDGKTDTAAESLMQDYKQMLGAYVPVTISRDTATNGYDVSGEIPDSLVDAIRLVHGVDEKGIVQDLVNYNLRTIGQECKILDVKLGEAVSRILMNVQDIPSVTSQEEVVPVSEEELLGIVDSAVTDGRIPDSEADEDSDFLSTVFTDSETEEDPDDELALLADTLTDESGTEFTGESEPIAEDIQMGEPELIAEDMAADGPEPAEPDAGRDFSAAIRRIYDKFCADLRAYGLDERLGLAF